nr:immunoglobulin light chain junction region [Macaca mulatta]MOX09358.1 immunoglobulin light chain junction region [Macaca mulatta]
CMEALDFPLTF